MITTAKRCAACDATWRGRHARWCARCGARLAGTLPGNAAPGRQRGPRSRGARRAAGVGSVLALAALVVVVLTGSQDGRLLPPPAPAPGQGEVDLEAALAAATGGSAATGTPEPGSTGLSLADPPADAPWLTEDGEPWHGDLTLDPEVPAGSGPPDAVAAGAAFEPVALDGTGWRVELDSPAVAATGDGEVVVTSTRDGALHALEADSGQRRWTTELGTAASGLLLRDGLVLVHHAGGQASVVSVADGQRLWRRAPGLEEDRVLGIGARDGVVLLSLGLPDRPRLLAADARDGTRRWERLLSEGWVADAAGEVAPIGVLDGVLTAFDPTSGEVRWEQALQPDERVVELVSGLVLVRGSGGYRWIDADDGQVRFQSSRLLGSWLAHPEDGLVLASAGGASLLASADGAGDERWRASLPRRGDMDACCVQLEQTGAGDVLVTDRRGPHPLVRLLDQADGTLRAELSGLEVAERRVLTVTPTAAVVVGASGTLGIDLEQRTPRWRIAQRTHLLHTDPVLLATERRGNGHVPATSSLLAPP